MALKTLPADCHDLAEALAGAALERRANQSGANNGGGNGGGGAVPSKMTASGVLNSGRFKGRVAAMAEQAQPFLAWFQ